MHERARRFMNELLVKEVHCDACPWVGKLEAVLSGGPWACVCPKCLRVDLFEIAERGYFRTLSEPRYLLPKWLNEEYETLRRVTTLEARKVIKARMAAWTNRIKDAEAEARREALLAKERLEKEERQLEKRRGDAREYARVRREGAQKKVFIDAFMRHAGIGRMTPKMPEEHGVVKSIEDVPVLAAAVKELAAQRPVKTVKVRQFKNLRDQVAMVFAEASRLQGRGCAMLAALRRETGSPQAAGMV
jgi:hypothetical protein